MRALFFIVVLVGCADSVEVADAPEVVTATLPDPVSTGEVLLDPVNIALDRGSLLVAEAHGWRLLRYPITAEPAPGLAAGLEVATATPGRPFSTWIPTAPRVGVQGQEFGRILSTNGRGRVVLSGVSGDLWTFEEGDERATRVGAGPGGWPAVDGAAVGSIDFTGAVSAAFDRATGALLIVTRNAVFHLPASGLVDGTTPLVRVVGSGALGRPRPGQRASSAPLRLTEGTLVGADGLGGLFLGEGGTGRLYYVPGYASAGAPLVHAAGGGNSLDRSLPARAQNVELAPGHALDVQRVGDEVRVAFFNRGTPTLLHIAPSTSDGAFVDARLEVAARTGSSGAGGLVAHRGHVLMSIRDEGTVTRFALDAEDGVIVAGHAPGETGSAASRVPRLGRPGGAVAHIIHGRAAAVLADDSTGKLLSYLPPEIPVAGDNPPQGQPNLLVSRTSGTSYELFRNLASVPTASTGTLLALGSRFKVQLFQVESGTAATLFGSGAGILPLDRVAMGSYFPAQPPRLLGVSEATGLLFFDPSERVLAAAALPISPSSRVEALAGHASSPRLPGLGGSSLNVVDVRDLAEATLNADGVGAAILRSAGRGDLVLAMRPGNGRGVVNVAAGTLRGRSGAVIGGGGSGIVEVGAPALDVGLAGVTGVAVTGEEVVIVRGTDLLRIDASGQITRVDAGVVPLGSRLEPGCEDGVLYALGEWGAARFDVDSGELAPLTDTAALGVRCDGGPEFIDARELFFGGNRIGVDAANITADGVPVSGRTMAALEGRGVADVRLADELPRLAGLPSGAVVAGVHDCLLRWMPDGAFSRTTPTEVLYEGAPLRRITAVAASDDGILIASDGTLYRFVESEGPAGARGSMTPVAGGGTRWGGTDASEAWFGEITGVLPGPGGKVLLRHTGAISLVDGEQLSMVSVGVGPAGDHPSLAPDPVHGGILVPDPTAQKVFRIAAPW